MKVYLLLGLMVGSVGCFEQQETRFSAEARAARQTAIPGGASNGVNGVPSAAVPQLDEVTQDLAQEETLEDVWDELLRKYVDEQSQVDYESWRLSPTDLGQLDSLAAKIRTADLKGLGYGSDDKKAFIINAYNILMVRLVLSEWPKTFGEATEGDPLVGRRSALNISNNPWKDYQFNVAGQQLTLDDLERLAMIEPAAQLEFKDSRPHFAFNCAAKGCPPIYQYAFRGDVIDSVLDQLARQFVQSNQDGQTVISDELKTSKLLSWYKSDFVQDPRFGSLQNFFAYYLDNEAQKNFVLGLSDSDIQFFEYDWELNQQ